MSFFKIWNMILSICVVGMIIANFAGFSSSFSCSGTSYSALNTISFKTGFLSAYDSKALNDDRFNSFDSDFAEAISKPLPQWYKESKAERERVLKEIEKNRDRIINEFKAKYEVSEQEKLAEKQEKLNRIRSRLEAKKSTGSSWITQALGLGSKQKSLVAEDSDKEIAEEVMSTKENWDRFWEEEEKQTGFYLPGFFEVFPELKLKWPTWSKRKDGSAIACETDADCPFPQACCAHPILPGERFCCTGWGQRIMVPAYAYQNAPADLSSRDEKGQQQAEEERENWRPSPDSASPF